MTTTQLVPIDRIVAFVVLGIIFGATVAGWIFSRRSSRIVARALQGTTPAPTPEKKARAFSVDKEAADPVRARVLLRRNALQALARIHAQELHDELAPVPNVKRGELFVEHTARGFYDEDARELGFSDEERAEGAPIFMRAFLEQWERLTKEAAS